MHGLKLAGIELFFFQAEDGIRDLTVTGVQTCALPIYPKLRTKRTAAHGMVRPRKRRGLHETYPPTEEAPAGQGPRLPRPDVDDGRRQGHQIGRASCRERV